MKNGMLKRRNTTGQRGMTLLELLIAMTVLTVGLIGLAGLLVTAVGSNGRSKNDTSATLVSQMFLEAIANQTSGKNVTIKDCTGTTITVYTTAPATNGTSLGANLKADNSGIDFTQAASGIATGYKATYTVCGGNAQTAFDVRWNIYKMDALSNVVTVASKTGANTRGLFFVQPASVRTIVTKY